MVKTTLICSDNELRVNYYLKVSSIMGHIASSKASYKTFNPPPNSSNRFIGLSLARKNGILYLNSFCKAIIRAKNLIRFTSIDYWKVNAIDSTHALVTLVVKFSKILICFMIAGSINELLANEMRIRRDEDYSMLVTRKKRDILAGLFEERNTIQK